MKNQKRENPLNLAPGATEEERLKSVSLNVGYDPGEKTWELIVRHNGLLEALRSEGIRMDKLAAGYTVLVMPQSRIDQVSVMEQIVYIEKPKRLSFAGNMARAAFCLSAIQTSSGSGTGDVRAGAGVVGNLESSLTGRDVLVTAIDSDIDYFHSDFRSPDGTTRIGLLADQDRDRIYTREEINAALETGGRSSVLGLAPSTDPSGHGIAVAATAAGNGGEGNGAYRGVTYESELMVVKLGTPLTDSFPRTTQSMKALDLVIRRTRSVNRPLAMNIGFGNTYGSHGGISLLETFISDMSNISRNVIMADTGNEGAGAGHRAESLVMGQKENAQLSIASYETEMGVQLWKSYADQFSIRLITPSGEVIGPIDSRLGPQTLRYGGTWILIYYDKPNPFSRTQEVYFDFLPMRDYLDSGIWVFRLALERIVAGRYNMWLPSRGLLNPSTHFLRSVLETALTIPSTATSVISVGAYDDFYRVYANFSDCGFTRQTQQIKPDLAAPGVDIVTARRGGGYEAVTGTSFTAPFVAGSTTLLMQWGILQGGDPFLYGEKVKAYFTRGTRHLPGYDV